MPLITGRRRTQSEGALEAPLDGVGLLGDGLRREEVYEVLRRAIVKGQLPEGERLVEAQLARTLSTSRTPVREALHKLEHDGLVTPLPRRGFVVRRITARDIGELFQLRLLLEPTGMREGAEVLDVQRRRELDRIVRRTERYLEAHVFDLASTVALHDGFHQVLLDACPSRMLRSTIEELRDRAAHLDRKVFGLSMYTVQHRQGVVEELPALHAAIRAGNWDGLQKMIAARLARARDMALASVGEADGTSRPTARKQSMSPRPHPGRQSDPRRTGGTRREVS